MEPAVFFEDGVERLDSSVGLLPFLLYMILERHPLVQDDAQVFDGFTPGDDGVRYFDVGRVQVAVVSEEDIFTLGGVHFEFPSVEIAVQELEVVIDPPANDLRGVATAGDGSIICEEVHLRSLLDSRNINNEM